MFDEFVAIVFGENKDAVGTLDHFFGHGSGAIIGKIDAVPRLDYFAGALVGLTGEFTPFFGNAARLYSESGLFALSASEARTLRSLFCEQTKTMVIALQSPFRLMVRPSTIDGRATSYP